MKFNRFTPLVALMLLVPAASFGWPCDDPDCPCAQDEESAFGEVSVEDLAALIDAGEAAVYDANRAQTRESLGVIPGAVLLSSHEFDVEVELAEAADAEALIFYCYNAACSASDRAAERAIEAGHHDVRVLRAGITGWVQAGKDVVLASPQE